MRRAARVLGRVTRRVVIALTAYVMTAGAVPAIAGGQQSQHGVGICRNDFNHCITDELKCTDTVDCLLTDLEAVLFIVALLMVAELVFAVAAPLMAGGALATTVAAETTAAEATVTAVAADATVTAVAADATVTAAAAEGTVATEAAAAEATTEATVPEIESWLGDINPNYGQPGYDVNCGHVFDAVNSGLEGNPVEAQSGVEGSWEDIEAKYGSQFNWNSSFQSIEQQISAAGDGARGGVGVYGDTGAGIPPHIFNVVNEDGVVTFIEGQVGPDGQVGGQVWRGAGGAAQLATEFANSPIGYMPIASL
jgi:hypothetical protein